MKIMKFKKIVYKEKYKKKYINNGNPVSKAKSKKIFYPKLKIFNLLHMILKITKKPLLLNLHHPHWIFF